MSVHDDAYQQLGEAQAIRIHGTVTARHPSAYPLVGLLMLRVASDRYGRLLRNRERASFAAWADRIEKDALAGIDVDRDQVVAALRAMDKAAQPPPAPVRLRDRIRSISRAISPADTTIP